MGDSALIAWPLAFVLATVAVAQGVNVRRRRERLNRALHELRRPLQALALARGVGVRSVDDDGDDHLDLALDALAGVDRAVNGARAAARRCAVDARGLVEDAVARWRSQAALARRPLRLSWRANGSTVVCDRAAIARALDNLIANSLEHGRGPITVEAVVRDARLRVLVVDGGAARGPVAPVAIPRAGGGRGGLAWRWGSPTRGHGLRIVADVAAAHGGRFAACRHRGGATAVIELPLARR